MKILRFTGHLGTEYVDVRFTTDMINDTDESFNIVQVQEGQVFDINQKKSGLYDRLFVPTFREEKSSIAACKAFADANTLDLRLIRADGTHIYLTDNTNVSNSDSGN